MQGRIGGLQSGPVTTVILLLFLLFGIFELKKTKPTEVQNILQQAADAAAKIQDESAKALVLKDIASVRNKAKGSKVSLEDADTIQDDFSQASSYQRIAAAKVKSGDLKGALVWSVSQEGPLEKSRALLGVAEGLIESRQSSKEQVQPEVAH